MASHAHDTKNVVQFFRDLQALKRPSRWTPDLLARTAKGVFHVRDGLAALPKTTILLSQEEGGQALAANLKARVMGVPVSRAASVLALPADPANYLKGRYRERLRTNISKANSLGLTSRQIDAAEFDEMTARAHRSNAKIKYLDLLLAERVLPSMKHWVGLDANGEPVAFARIQVDSSTAWLKCMVAIADDPRSVIRYKMSADMFIYLAGHGFENVISGSVLDLPEGLAHFQHLLGFRAAQIAIYFAT